MSFIDVTCDIDESQMPLGTYHVPPSKKKKLQVKEMKEDEQSAKTKLWNVLAMQLSQGNSVNARNEGSGHKPH